MEMGTLESIVRLPAEPVLTDENVRALPERAELVVLSSPRGQVTA